MCVAPRPLCAAEHDCRQTRTLVVCRAARLITDRVRHACARCAKERLVASAGFSCVDASASCAGAISDLHRLCEAGVERRVLYNVDEGAGADVATLTGRPDGAVASVVLHFRAGRVAEGCIPCGLSACCNAGVAVHGG